MAMTAVQTVHGAAMAASITSKQQLFLAPKAKMIRHCRRCLLTMVRSEDDLGRYINPAVADKEKEAAMPYRRTVFTHDDWLRHRSSARHGRHLASIASSRVILALGPPVFSLTAIATLVTLYNESHPFLPPWLPLLHISSLPFSLTAPALALLLVFRTNASYARFDEARKAWGMNVNRVRDVSRQALSFMRSPADAPKLQSFLHHAAAFSYVLKGEVCDGGDLEADLVGVLEQAQVEAVLAAAHRPSFVLQVMSELAHSASMTEMERTIVDKNLTQFHDNVGACERIFKTPIPLSYTRLTSRFLVIWHIALPLGLWDQCRWLIIPAVFFNAAALLCIDEVGVLIEEPFSSLALGAMCKGIKTSVDGLVEAHSEVKFAVKPSRRRSSHSCLQEDL